MSTSENVQNHEVVFNEEAVLLRPTKMKYRVNVLYTTSCTPCL